MRSLDLEAPGPPRRRLRIAADSQASPVTRYGKCPEAASVDRRPTAPPVACLNQFEPRLPDTSPYRPEHVRTLAKQGLAASCRALDGIGDYGGAA